MSNNTHTNISCRLIYWIYIKKRLEKTQIQDHDNPWAFSGLGLDEIKVSQIAYLTAEIDMHSLGECSLHILTAILAQSGIIHCFPCEVIESLLCANDECRH